MPAKYGNGVFFCFLVIKCNFQNAFFKFTIVDDANVLDVDSAGCKDGSNRSNGTGFIDDIAVDAVFFGNRTGCIIREGVPVITAGLK